MARIVLFVLVLSLIFTTGCAVDSVAVSSGPVYRPTPVYYTPVYYQPSPVFIYSHGGRRCR